MVEQVAAAPRSAKFGGKVKETFLVRFVLRQRIEHIVLMITFTALAVTGLAEKYFSAGWAEWLIASLGGIAATRFIHRVIGLVFAFSFVFHVGFVIVNSLFRHGKMTMLINLKDFHDIIDSLRYSFGFTDRPLRYGRYDYRQKFEYWGILFGGFIMIMSGLALMYPILTTSFLPGQVVAASQVAHSNEAMLAVLTIVIWHLYDVMFKPSVFPGDLTIFSGRISKKRMEEEHALEYAELHPVGEAVAPTPAADENPNPIS